MPKISIKPEILFSVGHFNITNSLLLSLVVFIFFVYVSFRYYGESSSGKHTGFYYFLNYILRSLYGIFESIVHENINVFFPLLAALFLWIIMQNWSGLLPGVGSILVKVGHEHIPLFRGNNADINATLALSLFSVGMTQVYGIRFLGFPTYIKKYINFSNPIQFILGILEIMSEISKVLSFSFRLFGNIFAGEVLLTIVAFLVPVLASFPFLILEVFVGFIQALVFSMLTSVFFSLAVSHH